MINTYIIAEESKGGYEHFDEKLMELSNEIRSLREQQAALIHNKDFEERMRKIEKALDKEEINLDVYSDSLIRHEVESVPVLSNGSIHVCFKNGAELEMRVI